MTRIVILLAATMAVLLATSPVTFGDRQAAAACRFKFQCSTFKSTSKTVPIYRQRDFTRERVGSIYDPGHGRPIQVLKRRDFTSEIILEIHQDGTITRPGSLREIGTISEAGYDVKPLSIGGYTLAKVRP